MGEKSAAEVLQPLYRMATSKTPGKKFVDVWKQENMQDHFDEAKQLLLLATHLNHPDPAAPLALVTDASAGAVGGCLEQYVNGKWEPLG